MRIFKKFQTSNKLARELKSAYKVFTSKVVEYRPSERAEWTILGTFFLLVTAIFFLYNLQFSKAELISDEIGYLTKAAAIAGYKIDNASSWHAGYSLFLAPVFRILNDPVSIRVGVFFINALLFGASLVMLFFTLENLFPKKRFIEIFTAVIVSSLYPAWIVMTGYAFATPAFLFAFMISVLILLTQKWRFWGVHLGIATGFLFWVHPLGLMVILSALFIIMLRALQFREVKVLASFILAALLMVLIYYKGLHPWLNDIMNMGVIKDHYTENINRLSALVNIGSWRNALTIALGRLSYVLIGTFGVVVFALGYFIEAHKQKSNVGSSNSRSNYYTVGYVLIALGVLILFTSLSLGANMYQQSLNDMSMRILYRVDHWIYGRYSDMLLLPLIGVGLLAKWRYRYAALAVVIVIIAGICLRLVVNESNTNLVSGLIAVNIPSFWPWAIEGVRGYLAWSLMGTAAILGIMLLRAKALFVVVPIIMITTSMQFGWQKDLVFDHGDVYSATQIIRNAESNKCIGLDATLAPDSHPRNRLRAYSFYLYDKNLYTQTYQEWLRSDCGFFFTDNPSIGVGEKVQPVFRSDYVQLFLFAKTQHITNIDSGKYMGTIYVNKNYPDEDICLLKGCFARSATQFKDARSNFVLAGELRGGSIVTNGDEGYMFHGPYLPLRAGSYKLVINGKFVNPNGAHLEIASTEPPKLIYESEIQSLVSGGKLEAPFEIKEDSEGVEIRLRVSKETDITVTNYEIILN